MKSIYFDHSATTPLDLKVLEVMSPFFCDNFGNASSIHSFGQKAALAVDQARNQTARFFNCSSSEVVFTSGATESNNMALKGLAKALLLQGITKPHFITSAIEHDAISEPMKELEREGLIELSLLSVNEKGLINLEGLQKTIKDTTALIPIMYVNSEIGVIQPIKQIGRLIEKINHQRLEAWEALPTGQKTQKPSKLYFHSDATQAVNFLAIDIQELKLDLVSLSAHKIYGPKGVGALIIKDKTPLTPIQRGGHHEKNLRSGTLNVPGIVGLGQALSLAMNDREKNNQQISFIRDYLINRIQKEIPDIKLNTDVTNSVPSHAHITFLKAEGESILLALDMEANIAVSTGSACASNTLKASSVLLAMGQKQEDTHGAIRFTLGKNNTQEDIDVLMTHLPNIVKKFRDMAPAY